MNQHKQYQTAQPRLPVGISDFQKLILGNYVKADKTLFIKDIMDEGADVILFTRPRRFGKTLNLSMLDYFFKCSLHQKNNSEDHNLFANLNIAEDQDFCKDHQNKYPTIFISFKDIKASNFEDAYKHIELLFSGLYSEHRYLLEGDLLDNNEKEVFTSIMHERAPQNKIGEAIKILCGYLHRKFGKNTIILIDEYDTPIQSAYLRDYYDSMIEVMRNVLGSSLKDNKFLGKAVLTGITRISQESLFSGLNNIKVYSLLSEKYGQYFGFTEEEVIKLKDKVGTAGDKVSIADIKDWYNGYRIGSHTLYNPWSIINCFSNNGQLEPYWLNTSSNDLIKELLDNVDYGFKKDFELLLQGEEIEKPLYANLVFPELKEKEEAIWSLFLYAGYLNVLSYETRSFEMIARICIPNREVMYVYDGIVAGWFRKGTSLDTYKKFIQSLKTENMTDFKRYIMEMLDLGSYFDFNKNTPEAVFHSFMLGLTVGLKDEYIIQSNIEGGDGRFDVVFIPKSENNKGILLEFKTSETLEDLPSKSGEALEQIKDKEYFRIFNQHNATKVLAIGLAFYGKKVELQSEIIELTER